MNEVAVDPVVMSAGDGSTTLGDAGVVDVSMDNSDPVGGFQFYLSVDPAIASIVSAETTDRTAGFNVSTANNIVLLFSITGDIIDPGTGPVVSLGLSGDVLGTAELTLENLVVSDPYGNAMATETSGGSFTVEDGDVVGCMDDMACNYNPDANVEGECEYAEENYDCDGNCIVDVDCAGDCGGSAEFDECGVCNGDGDDFCTAKIISVLRR